MENGLKPLLSVQDLKTYFSSDEGLTRAVDGASFDVYSGQDPRAWWARVAAARASPPGPSCGLWNARAGSWAERSCCAGGPQTGRRGDRATG